MHDFLLLNTEVQRMRSEIESYADDVKETDRATAGIEREIGENARLIAHIRELIPEKSLKEYDKKRK